MILHPETVRFLVQILTKKSEEDRVSDNLKQRKYYALNREKCIALSKAYQEKNKGSLVASRKAYYPRQNELKRLKRKTDPEYFRLQYQNRSDTERASRKAYDRDVVSKNPQHKLRRRLRCRIWATLKKRGMQKKSGTAALTGCEWLEFKAHFERLFQPGMTWENYGLWHVDHKKPCALFDLTDEAQQRECYHYANLQPLWAIDNLKKGARYVGEN